jgi:hypothetical protein
MLAKHVGGRLVHQLLQGGHTITAKLLKLMECRLVKFDQLAHGVSAAETSVP